jgi:hypothetical protein
VRALGALLLVATPLSLASPAASAPSPAQLLSTYAPIVLPHPDERFRPVTVESFLAASSLERRTDAGWQPVESAVLPVDAGPWRLNQRACDPSIGIASLDCYAATPSGPATVYARHTRTPGRIVLQYWLFYVYNFWSGQYPQSDFLWQVHEGDWEAVTILLSSAGKPLLAGYSQHCSGKRRAWARVAKQGTHPLVYVALGSHSSWFGPGEHVVDTRCYPQAARVIFEVNLPSVLDRTGTAGRVRPRVQRVTEQAPGWMRFRGTWGEDGWFRAPGIETVRFEAGPVGPAFQGKWRDPLRTVMGWPAG